MTEKADTPQMIKVNEILSLSHQILVGINHLSPNLRSIRLRSRVDRFWLFTHLGTNVAE